MPRLKPTEYHMMMYLDGQLYFIGVMLDIITRKATAVKVKR